MSLDADLKEQLARIEQNCDARFEKLDEEATTYRHDMNDRVNGLGLWKEAHAMESKLRGEALSSEVKGISAHLTVQDARLARMEKRLAMWAGGAVVLVWIIEHVMK